MANIISRQTVERRQFLRGGAAAIALPWLSAMAPALARPGQDSVAAPKRCAFIFSPNGMKMDEWTPRERGRQFKLSPLLQPLAPYRSSVSVISGLAIDGGRAKGDGPGDHARAAASFLTCAHPKKTGGADIEVGVSVDQLMAERLKGQTSFSSLELGMERGRRAGACDSGYSCAYTNNISWRSASTPVAKETFPKDVFRRLFGDPSAALSAEEEADRTKRRKSLLDYVLADTKSLSRRLGGRDRSKLDEYLTAVRELEFRLQTASTEEGESVVVPKGLTSTGGSYAQRLDLMYEIMALAWQSDRTRIISFMVGNAGSNRSYRHLGVSDGHHDLSHHGKKKSNLSKIRKINAWHIERFAGFLKRLSAVEEGGTSLLKSSAIVFGSGIADGNRHNHDHLPILIAGELSGSLRAGQHLRFKRETPTADLYLTLMRKMGHRSKSFADSRGVLPGL